MDLDLALGVGIPPKGNVSLFVRGSSMLVSTVKAGTGEESFFPFVTPRTKNFNLVVMLVQPDRHHPCEAHQTTNDSRETARFG
jgi:hypothetical protein